MTCLAYLAQFSKENSLNENDRQDCPRACYAAEHCISHARCGDLDFAPDILRLVLFRVFILAAHEMWAIVSAVVEASRRKPEYLL